MSTVTIIPATAQKPIMLRVAAYCRVSSDSADQLHSYAMQIRTYTELIESHENWKLVDIYADEGLTGTRMDKREEFNRMLTDCRKGKIDKILVKSISRFARNTKDCLVVLRELKLLNVSVQFEEDHIDTETLTSELMVSVFGSLAQQESTSISQNLRMSYQRRMERGEFITCKPPFGYKLRDGKQLEIIPEEAAYVSWIFHAYLNGMSQSQIADEMTQKGVPTTDGLPYWQETTIAYILTNEKYIGDALCQKTYTTPLPFIQKRNSGEYAQYYLEGSHPPIITKEVFDQAQALCKSRIYQKSAPNTAGPFHRRIFCGGCGSAFTRRVNKNGYVCYVCRERNKKVTRCSIGRVSESTLHTAFIQMYNRLRGNLDVILFPALKQLEELSEVLQKNNPDLAKVNLAIAETAEQSQKVSKLLSIGRISPDVYASKQAAIDAKLKQLKVKRRNILQNQDVDGARQALKSIYDIVQCGPEGLTTFDEELFNLLVERIFVDSSHDVRFQLCGGILLPETVGEAMK